MAKVIIEVAVNGNRHKSENPHLPTTAEQIADDVAACAEAGAAMFHVHPRDPNTGAATPNEIEPYKHAIRAIRKRRSDVLIYLTQPVKPGPTSERFRHMIELAEDPETKPDLGVCDVANVQVPTVRDGKIVNSLITNTAEELTEILELQNKLGYARTRLMFFSPESVHVSLAFVRLGILREPILPSLYFTKNAFSFPPSVSALNAYLELLNSMRSVWFAADIGGDILDFAPTVIAAGGHLRVGLEDYAYRAQGLSNVEIVRRAVAIIRNAGHEPATTDDARRMFEM